ncbi:chromosome partitioning protein ParB [Thioclava sp. BHET1]|nr:chromosome partitioning protein ParB [Thioclava sp. BHET1]
MAKRRKLEAPSAEDLAMIEAEFRRETPLSRMPISAPIAQVVAESAASHDPRGVEERSQAARDRADASRLQAAATAGLVMREIPLDAIEADALVRDRMELDPEEMGELQRSIEEQGVRLPIEVFALAKGQGERFGLLSGYRRLRAVRNLRNTTGQARFQTIRALIRSPETMGGHFAAMVEENEVRSNLSQFERGRIAVIAAQQGSFPSVEAAVDALFPVASKAKRSKIRSFALIFAELGDMLRHPSSLREKDGLRLAQALKDGHEAALRDALATGSAETPEAELELIELALRAMQPVERRKTQGGRPPREAKPQAGAVTQLPRDLAFSAEQDAEGWLIRLTGADLNADQVALLLDHLKRLQNRH